MEVITYQLVIVATIWIAYRINPRFGFWASIAWSAETLILLFFPPLIVIQLGVVWGTYFVLQSSAAKTRRIDQLQEQLRDHPIATRERLRTIDAAHLQFIGGREHERILAQAIQASRDRLCILSGWVSHKVVDATFVGALESALMRGVSVFLAYGSVDSGGAHSESRTAQIALSSLRGVQQKSERYGYHGKLHIAKFPNHEKILVKDDEFVVCGSNNSHFPHSPGEISSPIGAASTARSAQPALA